jgi:hypothetical protein
MKIKPLLRFLKSIIQPVSNVISKMLQYKRASRMDKSLKLSFSKINDNHCLETKADKLFYVHDCPHTKKSIISLEKPAEHHFKVINKKAQSLRFLGIDHCMFFDGDFKKCDFALYDNATFCFVELKEVKKDDHQMRRAAKKKAEQQLLSVIELFQNTLDFSKTNLEAYLCVGFQRTRPSFLSKSQRAMKDFVRLKTKLFDGCEREFS